MHILMRVCVLIFLSLCLVSAAIMDSTITVVASGEVHGMVEACDCPHDPGGGLSKRNFFIKTLGNRDKIILVDAGGFSAGGLYDTYTEGRKADSIKTIKMIKGMSAIGYDAVAVGDDDLQYGADWLVQQAKKSSLNLISANCFKEDGSLLFPAVVYIKKGGKTFAITALTTDEKILAIDKKVQIRDPISSLKKQWKEIVAKSDYQLILSHLGYSKNSELIDSFPECDFVVNGHRKNDMNVLSVYQTTPVLQFGFQGKNLSYATVSTNDKKFNIIKNGWYFISRDLPDDSSIVAAINSVAKEKSSSVYDLYIMSQCPYGLEALTGFTKFVKKAPNIDWNVWFIGTVENDTNLSSLHGPEEVKDEMLWLAIKDLYPKRWLEFLTQRAEKSVPTETIIKGMGLSKTEIDKWVNSNGLSQLVGQYLRSTRLDIKASPTLLVNNIPFDKSITLERLLKNQCQSTGEKSLLCDTLPQCFDNNDCKQKGKIGRCVEGKCVFSDAAPFTLKILVADSIHQHPEDAVIQTTEDILPGVIVEKIKMNSPEGTNIIKNFSPDALPFYLFSKDVKQAYNFDQVESGLIERNNYLYFKKGVIRNNYFFKRKLEKGKIILFVDPFFKEIPNILSSILADTSLAKKVTIVPVIYSDPMNDSWGTEEGFRQEEALRWLTLNSFYKDKLDSYLSEYSKTPGSSYWFRCLEKIGIQSDAFIAKLRANSDLLFDHWKTILGLSIREPIVVVFDNREVAIAANQKELEQLILPNSSNK